MILAGKIKPDLVDTSEVLGLIKTLSPIKMILDKSS
jgi:hypothetical protein